MQYSERLLRKSALDRGNPHSAAKIGIVQRHVAISATAELLYNRKQQEVERR